MRKGFTMIEVLIVVVIVGIIAAVFTGRAGRYNVAERCLSKGYVVAQHAGYYTRYCTKMTESPPKGGVFGAAVIKRPPRMIKPTANFRVSPTCILD